MVKEGGDEMEVQQDIIEEEKLVVESDFKQEEVSVMQ